MTVQHQQSEWVECIYSLSFMTLYECEWFKKKNEREHLQHLFRLAWDQIGLFPCLLFYMKQCYHGLHLQIQTGKNFFFFFFGDLDWFCVKIKTNVWLKIYSLDEHFHVTDIAHLATCNSIELSQTLFPEKLVLDRYSVSLNVDIWIWCSITCEDGQTHF